MKFQRRMQELSACMIALFGVWVVLAIALLHEREIAATLAAVAFAIVFGRAWVLLFPKNGREN